MIFSKFLKGLCVLTLLTAGCYAGETPENYDVKIGNKTITYPVQKVPGKNVSIVYIGDFVDNWKSNTLFAKELSTQIQEKLLTPQNLEASDVVLLMAGDKGNQFGTYLREALNAKDIVIVRSSNKGGDVAFQVDYSSITSPGEKTLCPTALQEKRIEGAPIIIIDDVLSSGGTADAVTKVAHHANGNVLAYAFVATEGQERTSFQGKPVFSLFHLPVFES